MLSNDERRAAAVSGSRMMHGGYADALPPTEGERSVLDAFFDTLIPPEDGWPPAAELDVSESLVAYLVPDDAELSFYPHLRRTELIELLEARVPGLAEAGPEARIRAVRGFEEEHPAEFGRLRDFFYYVYYGSRDVVELIRQRTRFGGGYNGRPQPTGYVAVLEDWGRRPFTARGAFIPTGAVVRAPQARKAHA